jgi:hypothetical protein
MRRTIVLAVIMALLLIPPVSTSVAGATPKCAGFKATKVGTPGPDVIYGTPKRDVIVTKGGADRVFSRGGNDIVCAGRGGDVVKGGAGKDRIFGGPGSDRLYGDGGFDRINGGSASDKCFKGGGGASLKQCEKADLEVKVSSPEIAAPDTLVPFTIEVTNNGPSAVAYDLLLSTENSGVSCSGLGKGKGSGTFPRGKLASGAKLIEVFHHMCELEGPIGVVTVTAKARAKGIDPNGGNNEGESDTTIKPA